MKKLFALLIALMMLNCATAMAEAVEYELIITEPVDFTEVGSDIKINDSLLAANGADTAIITDNMCTIYSDNLIINFDHTQGSFIFVTQDFYASYMGYMNMFNDAQAGHQSMLDNAMHLQIYDQMFQDIYVLRTIASISMKGSYGTLSMLPENVQTQLGEQIAMELGGAYGGIVKVNNTVWIKVEHECYITIVDGNILLLNGTHINNGTYEVLMDGTMESLMPAFDITLAQ